MITSKFIGLINHANNPSNVDKPVKTVRKPNENRMACSIGFSIPIKVNTETKIASLVPTPEIVIGSKPTIFATTIAVSYTHLTLPTSDLV